METQKRIQELEEELNKELNDFGADYQVFTQTTQDNKKINGKHIQVTFPVKVKINIEELVKVFVKYYGDITKISKVSSFVWGTSGIKRNQVTLNLE